MDSIFTLLKNETFHTNVCGVSRFFGISPLYVLSGLLSFLQEKKMRKEEIREVCQRPKRAPSISTSFLQEKKWQKANMCQRPKRALFISTTPMLFYDLSSGTCVNALNGLSSFLQTGKWCGINLNKMVSTP